MSRGLLFWILMLLWLLSGMYVNLSSEPLKFVVWGWGWIPFVLFVLLGWERWGPPVKG